VSTPGQLTPSSLSANYTQIRATNHGGRKERERDPTAKNRPEVVRSTRCITCITDPHRMYSFQDALRAFFQPIKTDDPRLDFYTMYKREATEYDTDYVKKYDEDLNTTLIFVRYSLTTLDHYFTRSLRRVCSPPSARLSSLTSTPTSDLARTSNPPPSFAPFSSLSINPPFPVRLPLSHLFRKVHRARSSPPPVSCTRVS